MRLTHRSKVTVKADNGLAARTLEASGKDGLAFDRLLVRCEGNVYLAVFHRLNDGVRVYLDGHGREWQATGNEYALAR
jgi:hypothetical protein